MKNFRGSITLLVLIFGGIFLGVLMSLSSYVLTQNRISTVTRIRAIAFNAAEAGLEYYRWHLAHFPTDLENGTGAPGPYAIPVPDPEGGALGTASLSIHANTACGETTSIDITSTGTAAEDASQPQTLIAHYAQPSVAAFSYIVNNSVWAGSDRIINGPYHSNGGVRMDGTANAPVTSSLSSWTCTSSFGCSPNATEPGVFGSGSNQGLWSYPTPQVDFAGIAADFSSLKTKAQASGLYFARYSTGNRNSSAYHKGYHLLFNANGTVTVKRVTATTKLSNVVAVDNPTVYSNDYSVINNEATYGTYTIPSGCGLIFVEDNTWIEGSIPAKVTVVVANITDTGVTPDAFLPGNITYASADGTDGLTLISQHDVLITANSPNDMTLDGVFIAQSGAFGRNYYGNYGCGGTYEPRNSLTILGSTISNLRTGTAWINGCGTGSNAGYQTRVDAYDRNLANDPPPFTPTTSKDYKFVDWQQE